MRMPKCSHATCAGALPGVSHWTEAMVRARDRFGEPCRQGALWLQHATQHTQFVSLRSVVAQLTRASAGRACIKSCWMAER